MRHRGTVVSFRHGWGLIQPRDGLAPRIFVHWAEILTSATDSHPELFVGDVVEYQVGKDDRGRTHAARVKVIQRTEAAA